MMLPLAPVVLFLVLPWRRRGVLCSAFDFAAASAALYIGVWIDLTLFARDKNAFKTVKGFGQTYHTRHQPFHLGRLVIVSGAL